MNFPISLLHKVSNYLPAQDLLKLYRLNKQIHKSKIIEKFVKIEKNEKQYEFLYHFRKGEICKISIKDVIENETPIWDKQPIVTFGKTIDIIDGWTHTMLISDYKLICLNTYNDVNLQVHLTDNTADALPAQGVKRWQSGQMYRPGDRHIWVIAGNLWKCGQRSRHVKRLDLNNLKWEIFENTIYDHLRPGIIISQNYLWVFSVKKLERMNLADPTPKWQEIKARHDFGDSLKTIKHETLLNSFHIIERDSYYIITTELKHFKMTEKVVCFDDPFYNSNPVVYQGKMIGLGQMHIHILDMETKEVVKRGCGTLEI